MVTSPNERKIHEWDKKKPSKKQTNKQLKPLSFLESHTYCDTGYLTPVAERFAVELSLLDSMI